MDNFDKLKTQGNPTGVIAWMVNNRVTPNILMLILIVGGFFVSTKIKQEFLPDFDLDMVNIKVAYPGSSPEEVEQGIILAVEEAIRGLDGVKEIAATASEGMGSIKAELLEDVDAQRVYQDIKQEIDRITTFPEEAEQPEVSLAIRRREVINVEIYGDVGEWALRDTVEHVRDRLLQDPGITQIDLKGERNYEIHVEISQDTLRTYGLTLRDIAQKINSTSVELSGGTIETKGGDILLKVNQRSDWADEFAKTPIVSTLDGSIILLSDIATVKDTFEDSDRTGMYNGVRSMGVSVFRVGDQTPVGVAKAVKKAMAEIEEDLPQGVNWAVNKDMSEVYQARLDLLFKNAFFGLLLVLALLSLFLEYKLAFWVTMGIPTSFLGAFLFLPQIDVTINMMSMFAFIIALGIVVDDAIVAGENIYEYRQRGLGLTKAAILGARDVAVPVSFSIITNIIAFIPLCFVPGTIGKIFKVIPLVVISVFVISWVESLFILPAHLAHSDPEKGGRLSVFIHKKQQSLSGHIAYFIKNIYGPFLDRCIKYRYLTIALGLMVLIVVLGYVKSGRIGIILMPRAEADHSDVTATLPYGCAYEKSAQVCNKIVDSANKTVRENGGEELSTGIFALIDENVVRVSAYLTDAGTRPISTSEFTKLWRENCGHIPNIEALRFQSDRGGPGSGQALTVELSHRDINVLDQASEKLARLLSEFPNVKDIDDGYTPGKQQLDFTIKAEGESLGLTARNVANQVRGAFYGAQALRQQRGRNEIKVKVRFPESQRIRESNLETLLIRTPSGTDVPLTEIAQINRGRAYTQIHRRNARRTVTVTADIVPISQTSRVIAALNADVLPQLVKDFPGLSYGYEGKQADMKESMQKLFSGLILSLIGIFIVLAMPFKSYTQPLVVMVAIPFGVIGAVMGHMIMGYSLSIMSLMGIVALVGVVVNDSLVLINYSNHLKNQGATPSDAIHNAGIRRFRAIILTSLTTFGGLAPMIFETSRQARFIIPMAISLGYGILFATGVTLILVPSLSMILEDIHAVVDRTKQYLSS